MAITLTIDGTTRQWKEGTLLIDEPLNEQPRLSLEVFNATASWRPALDDEVIVTQDSATVFGGYIAQAREHSPDNKITANIANIVTEITAVSYAVLTTYRYVTRTFTSATLEANLQILVDEYLDDYGVSLDAGQVTGPTLPELVYSARRLDEVLSEWSRITGYVWQITYDKELRMFTPGSEAAPTSITQANGRAIGDVIVEPKRGPYFNRVVLRAGQNVQVDKTDTYTGNGSEDTYTLTYPMVYTPTVGYGYVTNGDDPAHPGEPLNETLDLVGIGSGATWEYDPSTNSITRVAGAPANLNAISITYPAQFPITVTAEDAGEIAAHGIRERLIAEPDVYDIDVAQDIADASLSTGITVHREVTYTTEEVGLRPGQTQTITFAVRNLNATCTIMQVRTRDVANKTLFRTITAVEGAVAQEREREKVYRDWLEHGDAGSVAVTSSGGGVPFPPHLSVQFNRNDQFGGTYAVMLNEDETSLKVSREVTIFGDYNLIHGDSHAIGSAA